MRCKPAQVTGGRFRAYRPISIERASTALRGPSEWVVGVPLWGNRGRLCHKGVAATDTWGCQGFGHAPILGREGRLRDGLPADRLSPAWPHIPLAEALRVLSRNA